MGGPKWKLTKYEFAKSHVSLGTWLLVLYIWGHPVEAYWKRVKQSFERMLGTYADIIQSHLDEYMFRERYGRTGEDMFDSMVKTIIHQHPFP